jgi:ribosome-associated protein
MATREDPSSDMTSASLRARVDPDEVTFEFFRASGPGGQKVNKVATAVRLRFDVRAARALPGDVKQRLARMAGARLTDEGVLIIEARRYRTQERNRQDALERLDRMLQRAWRPPKPRRPTKPTKASLERRLEAKKRRGEIKRRRRGATISDE